MGFLTGFCQFSSGFPEALLDPLGRLKSDIPGRGLMRSRSADKAFTLIEVLVVLGIIGILTGIIIPAVLKARTAGERLACMNNLKQLGVALTLYDATWKVLPPGANWNNGKAQFRSMGWQTHLLPFIEQGSLWDLSVAAFKVDPFFVDNPPHVGLSTGIKLFACQSDPAAHTTQMAQGSISVALTSYVGNAGLNYHSNDGLLFTDSRVGILSITDGASNTIMVAERPAPPGFRFGWWYAGAGQNGGGSCDMFLGASELNTLHGVQEETEYGKCSFGPYSFRLGSQVDFCDVFHYWSFHAGGANFLFGDGSVHFLLYTATSVLPGLSTRSGGESAIVPD
jgi:prepilin-type N-terminal cleavage/methylation domain-containing protein/prepilin-type processing-associated H-X9-DG protein